MRCRRTRRENCSVQLCGSSMKRYLTLSSDSEPLQRREEREERERERGECVPAVIAAGLWW